ncbi:MAG: methyltransferase domain-containing protein [Candidatus Omnitrophota bacterium]|nr:methyltransferase domain-containing protein [Candidatus Omnitrophota bacterium]
MKRCDLMDDVIKQVREKLKLFKKYGYDIPKAREFIISKAKLAKGGSMLEIGTGRGHMATLLAKKGFKFVSIDLDRKAQDATRLHLKTTNRVKFVTLKIMNAEKLQYKDDFFYQVISVNFIHHAENPVRCLKEMIRVTKDKLIIADINRRGERIMEKVHRLDGHSHEASKISLLGVKKYLRRAGLVVRVYKDVCQTVIIAKKGAAK